MLQDRENTENSAETTDTGISLIDKITPLARQVNCLDIEKIANVCVNRIPQLVGANFASLYILDEKGGILHLQKYNHPYILNKIVSLNQNPPSPMVMSVLSKELIMIGNIDTHQTPRIKKSQRVHMENYKTKNCAIIPLICHDRVVGVLNIADKMSGDDFTSGDLALLNLFSQLVGSSIGNIKMFEKIQYQATTDGLTGLANHKTFYGVLEKELWRARRYGGKVTLIMVDIDNLKKINDTYGHRVGDKIIMKVSKRIKECIRQTDTAARYGGDEFAVVLPNTSVSDALIVAERMVNMVAASPIAFKGEMIEPSISVGLGEYDASTNPEDVTSRSDKALYVAKQAGKSTVRVYEPS